MKKSNGLAKWIIVALAVAGFIFNSGVLWNDVRHLKQDIVEIKENINKIGQHLWEGKND